MVYKNAYIARKYRLLENTVEMRLRLFADIWEAERKACATTDLAFDRKGEILAVDQLHAFYDVLQTDALALDTACKRCAKLLQFFMLDATSIVADAQNKLGIGRARIDRGTHGENADRAEAFRKSVKDRIFKDGLNKQAGHFRFQRILADILFDDEIIFIAQRKNLQIDVGIR